MKKLASLLMINGLVPTYVYKCNNQNKNFQKRVTSLESLFI